MARKILVVDDEKLVRWTIETFLKSWGYEVYSAGDPKEALEIFSKSAIELVITDLKMPGMNGIELAREIKSKNPKVKIILVTGYNTPQVEREAKEVGISHALSKPIKAEVIKNVIEEVLVGGNTQ